MNNQILIINAQSFVDVITNSSSELFICNTDKSIDLVNEILESMLNAHNEKEGYTLAFDDCFGAVSIVGDNNKTGTYFIDDLPSDREGALEKRRVEIIENYIRQDLEKDPKWSEKDWNTRDKIIKKYTDASLLEYKRDEKLSTVTNEKTQLPDWWYTGKKPNNSTYPYSYDDSEPLRWRGQYKGKVIIESVTDNSIPYDLFDEIQSMFSAERHHLG